MFLLVGGLLQQPGGVSRSTATHGRPPRRGPTIYPELGHKKSEKIVWRAILPGMILLSRSLLLQDIVDLDRQDFTLQTLAKERRATNPKTDKTYSRYTSIFLVLFV